MILQELLRNIVTYKEFIKPYIEVWKEALVLRYDSIQTQVMSENKVITASIREAISVPSLTGTRTIPIHMMLSLEHDVIKIEKQEHTIASVGNSMMTMLMGDRAYEDVVITVKTISSHNTLCLSNAKRGDESENNLTTGFTIEKPYLTHEGRELLGGFSLSHERHPLLYLTERR